MDDFAFVVVAPVPGAFWEAERVFDPRARHGRGIWNSIIYPHIMKNIIWIGCLSLACLSIAQADVTIRFRTDSVYDASGAPVPISGLGLLVADTGGNGFGPIQPGSLAAGSVIGSSDLILYRADFSTFDDSTPGIWYESANLSLSGGWKAGDPLAFVWFPTLTISSTEASEGDFYGLATYSGWVTPSDGGSVVYQLITTTNYGLLTPSVSNPTLELSDVQARASLQVQAVPEPAAFALLAGALGLVFVTIRRRR